MILNLQIAVFLCWMVLKCHVNVLWFQSSHFSCPPCEHSWRATWLQVSERLCRGSFWRWRACTVRSARVTPSSRPWFAGSVDYSDSQKAKANTKCNDWKINRVFILNESHIWKLNHQGLLTSVSVLFLPPLIIMGSWWHHSLRCILWPILITVD